MLQLMHYSDARSADVVDQRIRPALESGARVGSSRPYLVVIDEIDGATGGSDNVRVFLPLTPYVDSPGMLVWWLHPQTHSADSGQAKKER